MSRAARKKETEAVYHVMARSITEFDFFQQDADKEKFLNILRDCNEQFDCKIYGYCLMSTHYHILIDPNGYDISKFMKSLNLRYVKHVNKTYKRRGSLLAERFNSKIVANTEYALTVSAYIHNNAKDLQGYGNNVFDYPYSSMGIFLGKQKDTRGLIDTDFILGCINENDRGKAVTAYAELVANRRDTELDTKLRKYLEDFNNEQYEYRSYRTVLLRDKKPEEVIEKIAAKFGIEDTREIMHRWKRSTMRFREAVAYALTVYCGMGTRETCGYMKNISGTCLAKLRNRGYEQFRNKAEWENLLEA